MPHCPESLSPAVSWSLIVSLAFCLACVGTAATAGVFVVAQMHPNASDENPGTPEEPFMSISCAAKVVQPGDTVVIEDGIYREPVTIETSGTADAPILFAAAPMANVVVTGANSPSDWRVEEDLDGVFSTAWPYEWIGWAKRRAHPDDDYHLMIGRAEQVHVDRYPLLQVLAKDKLSRGTFYVDLADKRLYVCDRAGRDLSKGQAVVEASARETVLRCEADHVQFRGLRLRYAANRAQHGAVTLVGNHLLLQDCVVESMNGSGAAFVGDDIVISRCTFRDNGWSGFDVTASDFLMTECLCENNNVKDWNRGWGAVNKLVLCKNAVIEKSTFRDNHGHGIWFDIGNEECTIRNCLILDNDDSGIFYEISYSLHAHDNVIIGNGLVSKQPSWGANGGISLSSSPYCVVERNLLIANKEGIQFREQGRSTPVIGGPQGTQYRVWNHDNIIRNNAIVHNRDVQTAGWFTMPDLCHWPRSMQEARSGKAPEPMQALPEGTSIDRLDFKPTGMCLEDLRLALRDNLYAAKPGQRLYQWGCVWDKYDTYTSLDQVRATIDQERGSRVAPVAFADWARLDLRVPRDSPLLSMGCYPQGEVPGVRLGVMEE